MLFKSVYRALNVPRQFDMKELEVREKFQINPRNFDKPESFKKQTTISMDHRVWTIPYGTKGKVNEIVVFYFFP